MSKTTNKFSPEVRERAVRMVLGNEGGHGSRWQAITSISAKIGCSANTLNDWVQKAEVDSGHWPKWPTVGYTAAGMTSFGNQSVSSGISITSNSTISMGIRMITTSRSTCVTFNPPIAEAISRHNP